MRHLSTILLTGLAPSAWGCGGSDDDDGAASIPILMDEEFRAGRLPPGTTCVLSAFGAGYLWGSALLRF